MLTGRSIARGAKAEFRDRTPMSVRRELTAALQSFCQPLTALLQPACIAQIQAAQNARIAERCRAIAAEEVDGVFLEGTRLRWHDCGLHNQNDWHGDYAADDELLNVVEL